MAIQNLTLIFALTLVSATWIWRRDLGEIFEPRLFIIIAAISLFFTPTARRSIQTLQFLLMLSSFIALAVNQLPPLTAIIFASGVFLIYRINHLNSKAIATRASQRKKLFAETLIGFAVSALLIKNFWTKGYWSPLFDEKIIAGEFIDRVRYACTDMLFHTSIANHLLTVGYPSTGLHGPKLTPYHFGSHAIVAGLSSLSGLSTHLIYTYIFPFLCLLLILISARYAISELSKFLNIPSTELSLNHNSIAAMTLFMGFGYFLQSQTVEWLSLTTLLSESHFFGVGLQLAWFGLLINELNSQIDRKNAGAWPKRVLILVSFSLATLTKISAGTVCLVLFGFLFLLFWKRINKTSAIALLSLHALFFVILFKLTVIKVPMDSNSYFAMIRESNNLALYIALMLLPLTVSWLSLRTSRSDNLKKILQALLLTFLAALVPGNLIDSRGNWGYFVDGARWLMFPLLVLSIGNLKYSTKLLPRVALASLMIIGISAAVKMVQFSSAERLAIQELTKPRTEARNIILKGLKELSNYPLEAKRGTLIYIPKSNLDFWQLLPDCEYEFWAPTTQFIASSYSGFSMLYGMPIKQCAPANYNFMAYDMKKTDASNLKEACDEARRLGFSQLFYFPDLSSFRSLNFINCN